MKIPIVFSVDDNVVVPCGVTICSLLLNASIETRYEFYVLYNSDHLQQSNRDLLQKAFPGTTQYSLSLISVNNTYTVPKNRITGHLSTAAFYRLEIPSLFPQYDRIIYSDCDMIYQQDLSDVFSRSLEKGEWIAAVLDLAVGDYYLVSDLPQTIGKSTRDYFNSGFLILNLSRMRENGIETEFKKLIKEKFEQNDQDILNIACSGKVQILPSLYNFQVNHFMDYMWRKEKSVDYSFGDLYKKATLHYTWKHKPWNSLECVGNDTWWHYYKMSPFYDDKVYFQRQQEQIDACRNDYRRRTNWQLFKRILVNWKHKLLG